jgi:hypothetical protein
MADNQTGDGTSFDVRTRVLGGAGSLHIDARITTRDGWNAFCEAINTQGLALWPPEPDPEPEAKPRKKRETQAQGDPDPASHDGRVLAFARQYLVDNKSAPDVVTVADALDLHTLVARTSIGRLRKRGVWPG